MSMQADSSCMRFMCRNGTHIVIQDSHSLKHVLHVQSAEFLLSGTVGAAFVVSLAVLRIYLGWSYVGDRLLSAAVAYEETGWYDGQVFIKPPEVLTRDRLLGTYEVKPTLARLKTTLLGTGGVLLLSSTLLFGLISSKADGDGMYGVASGPFQGSS